MDMPFYFFFGLLGLAVGALVVWLLLADHPFEGPEPPIGPVDEVEATMLVRAMAGRGSAMDEKTVVDLIELHTAYLEGRISDDLVVTARPRGGALQATATDRLVPESAAVEGAPADDLSHDPSGPEFPERD